MRKTGSIARILSTNMAWRSLPLLILLFIVGVMGTYSSAIYYDRLSQLRAFDNEHTQNLLFIMQTAFGRQAEVDRQLSDDQRIAQTYYHYSNFFVMEDDLSEQGFLTCFSGSYLKALRWPVRDSIRESERQRDAMEIWADERLRARHSAGDILQVSLLDEQGRSVVVGVQITGFLPSGGWHPSAPMFYDYAKPTVEGLSQKSNPNTDPMILVGDYDALRQQILTINAEFSMQESIVALRLQEGLGEREIQELQNEIFSNLQGAAYTVRQIKQSTLIDWRGSMKRNDNNTFVLMYVVLWAAAAIQTSLIHRKNDEMESLRILGASWSSIQAAWLMILLLLCAAATLFGACMTEALSGQIDAFSWLSVAPWLRLIPVALIILITLVTNQLIFCMWRKRMAEE